MNFETKIVFYSIVLFFMIAGVLFSLNGNFLLRFSREHNGIQNIHKGFVPRIGGFCIFLISFFYYLDNNNFSYITTIYTLSIPLIIVTLSEDNFHNISPFLRLIIISLTCLLILLIEQITLPVPDLPLLTYLFEYKFFNIIFLTFCMVILINGLNIIDGTNGLMVFTSIAQLCSIVFLAFLVEDYEIIKFIFPFICFLITFLMFNFPLGKIFAGDTGAYFIGIFVAISIIIFFGRHNELNTWNAALILFYPVFEVGFSFFRKLNNKHSPFLPDPNHVHLKMFFFLDNKLKNKFYANNITTIALIPLWLLPAIFLFFSHRNLVYIFISLFLMIFIYLIYYWFLPNKKEKVKKL